MFEVLKSSPLFKGFDAGEIKILLEKTPHQVKTFSNKEVIAFAGDKVEKAILILEGKLQGEMMDFSGNRLKIEEMEPPQMIAAAFLFGPDNFFPVNLSALSEGKLLIIYRNEFTGMLSQNPRILLNYLNIISGKAQFLSQKITFLSYRTIREKIAFFLLQRMKRNDDKVETNLNQTQLAQLMGVARPSLARTIKEMETENLLEWEKYQVKVINPAKLNLILGR